MIETYKIITGKYQGCVAPSLIKEEIYVTRGNDFRLQKLRVRYDLRKFGFSNRVVNTGNSLPNCVVLLIGLPLTHLKLDWMNCGTVKILYRILEHSCRELEVVVKCCVRNFSNLVYCEVISTQDAGIKASACARQLHLRLRLRHILVKGSGFGFSRVRCDDGSW